MSLARLQAIRDALRAGAPLARPARPLDYPALVDAARDRWEACAPGIGCRWCALLPRGRKVRVRGLSGRYAWADVQRAIPLGYRGESGAGLDQLEGEARDAGWIRDEEAYGVILDYLPRWRATHVAHRDRAQVDATKWAVYDDTLRSYILDRLDTAIRNYEEAGHAVPHDAEPQAA